MGNVSKELKVAALKDGMAIDHIPTEKLFKVISILRLEHTPNQVTFGYNLDSNKIGKKAIIKVSGRFFDPDEVNKIALIAPKAKINIIKNYEVVEKKTLVLPDEIFSVIRCMNPKCITNNEPVTSHFYTVDKELELFKCHYCERIASIENLTVE